MTPSPVLWTSLLLLLLLTITGTRSASLDLTSPSTPTKPTTTTVDDQTKNVMADDKPDGKSQPPHSALQKSNETLDSVLAAENNRNKTGRKQRLFLDEVTAYVLNSDGTEVDIHALVYQDSVIEDSSEVSESMAVRKCCELSQFYNLQTEQCEDADGDTGIDAAVIGLASSSDANRSLQYHTGLLQECPGTGMVPTISNEVDPMSHTISGEGHLVDQVSQQHYDHSHYCVELAAYGGDQLDIGYLVSAWCQMWPSTHVEIKESGSLGKCCPHRHYLNMLNMACVPDDKGLHLEREPQMRALNVTELTYTSFPECTNPEGFFQYSLDPDVMDDYAVLGTGQVVEIVSTDGRCVLTRTPYEKAAYCIEYAGIGSTVRPIILVCAKRWAGADVHTEKFNLMAVLLGLSCAALLATAFSLVSTRVRRGLVTVKKVNTLAGRILLSYVMSYLVAFFLLAVNMQVEVTQHNPECHVMAGLLIFFLLAAFLWNTSICLESLLLTFRVRISEGRRYLLHSAWAWGVLGLITTLALTLDYHRHSLPCGVITPRIGVNRCFFSDQDAKLVYLYVPMMLSLLANSALLFAARYVRAAKLRRLERNCNTDCEGTCEVRHEGGINKRNRNNGAMNKRNRNNGAIKGQVDSAAPHISGLRIHQTRNLWSESVKLVIWSGGTWLLEVLNFVVSHYVVKPSESWYDYLWYLPGSVNALRGVGIFFILVFTSENRFKLSRWLTNMGLLSLAKNVWSSDLTRSKVNHQSLDVVRTGQGRRNMSIATIITQLSSISSSHSNNSHPDSKGVGRGAAHPNLGASVSQVDDTRRGSFSSQSSEFVGFELDTEVGPAMGAGCRKKTSLANVGPSLPSVHEEEHVDDLSTIHSISNDATGSTSDA